MTLGDTSLTRTKGDMSCGKVILYLMGGNSANLKITDVENPFVGREASFVYMDPNELAEIIEEEPAYSYVTPGWYHEKDGDWEYPMNDWKVDAALGFAISAGTTDYVLQPLFVEGDYAASAENVFAKYATVGADGKITVTGQSGDPVTFSLGKFEYKDSRTFFSPSGVGNDAYAAMIVTTTGTDGKDYYIANIATWTFSADMDKTIGDMGAKEFGTGAAIAGWTVAEGVPEPTSGLLLLLGVAGLALKRKRA